tara:strand:+ start:681 stop:1892 length:1212 start_codon:yes stop_codon:yes gene_type:complete
MKRLSAILAVLTLASCVTSTADAAEPLLVYILAGQSNMQGHAQVRTLDHLGMDPRTVGMLKKIRNADGTPRIHKDIWISSVDTLGEDAERHGRLTTGYGASGRGAKIGPELTFGITMHKHVKRPILIIKTAWGGKSIHTDFRPPSAGPYRFNSNQIEGLKRQKKDIKKILADKEKATGAYYRHMMAHIRKVLGNIKRVVPDHDPSDGHQLAGFVWFQGWNDMVDRGTYPRRNEPGGYSQYTHVLSHFIRDVRKDLNAPGLPFVIGVMGVGGPTDKYGPGEKRYKPIHDEFRSAMAAPALLPEFRGNVLAVRTEKYWDAELSELVDRMGKVNGKRRQLSKDKSLDAKKRKALIEAYTAELFTEKELKILKTGQSNAAYHYLGSAKILGGIGKAFADAQAKLAQP